MSKNFLYLLQYFQLVWKNQSLEWSLRGKIENFKIPSKVEDILKMFNGLHLPSKIKKKLKKMRKN